MRRFLLARLALLVPTLLGVLAVTFLLLYVAPGDPVQAMVGERADPAANPGALVIGDPETASYPEGELDLYFNNPGLAG